MLLFACIGGDQSIAENEDSENKVSPYYQSTLNLISTDKSISEDSLLNAIYSQPKLFWLDNELKLNSDGFLALSLITNSEKYGLNKANYNSEKLDSLSKIDFNSETALMFEINLTKGLINFGQHINSGIIPMKFRGKITDLNLKKETIDFVSIFKSEDIVNQILNLQPQHIQYIKLQIALAQFITENQIEDDVIYIPNFKKDSVGAYNKAKEVLVKLNYLNPSDSGGLIVEAVKAFQKDNGLTADGLIGKYTVQILEFTTKKMYFQAAANLEKWRWMESWGSNYIFVNIPEFLIRVFDHDSLVVENRTVVGTTVTQTPEVESKLEYFIVNPEWYVPYSITTNELIPKAKKDPNYLQNNGYAISSGDKSLSDIDWSTVTAGNFKYTIKQKSGGSNALGKVKFIFDNKHSVYFHDTPSKSFFKKDIRTYSHGCIRVQDPFEIADYLLQNEQNPKWPTTLDSLLKYKTTKTFTLQKEYPVHIGYFSSSTDSSGKLRTLIDVYQKDTLLLKLFEEYYWN